MKPVLTAALLAATLVPAQATPMNETDRTHYIGNEMHACVGDMLSYGGFKARFPRGSSSFEVEEWQFRTWSQTDKSSYCGCYSVTTSSRYTQEDINFLAASGKNPPDMQDRIVDPAVNHCKKYLPLPDVSSIKNKKW